MRPVRALVLCLLVAAPSVANADLVTRMLDDASASPNATADDLMAWAGTPQPITLPELLQFAVQQAPSLQNAKLDIAVAEAQIGETWARRDWHVSAQATGTKTAGFFSGFSINNEDIYGVTADLSRVLPTGGTFDLHAGTQYSKYTIDVLGSAMDSTTWQDTLSASLTQPLLKGRGQALYDATEKKAKLQRDATVLARRLAAINTLETIVSGYWDLVLAERQVAITEASLDLARERLRVTEIEAKGGRTAQSEIPAVLQIIATRQEDVLNGQLAVVDASIALRRAAGMPIGAGALGFRVPTELDAQDRGWKLADLLERAYAASPELAQLAKQDASATIDVEVTENGLLPQLDAAVSIGPLGIDSSASNALKQLAEFKSIAITGSLTFSRSIQQRDVKYRVTELRTAREKLRVNAFDVRAQYAQAMSRAVAQVELAKRRVGLSQQAIDLANQNIKIETDRFNLGRSTNFDVLNRLEDLRQAELRKAQALVDWHKGEALVVGLTGEILPLYGVTLD